MPHNIDFDKIKNVLEIKINPTGWIEPIIIEYGHLDYGVTPSIYWKVKGTLHTFIMPLVRLEYLSSGNYASHFEKVLEIFRDDYLGWKNSGFNLQWQQEYNQQYKRFIL